MMKIPSMQVTCIIIRNVSSVPSTAMCVPRYWYCTCTRDTMLCVLRRPIDGRRSGHHSTAIYCTVNAYLWNVIITQLFPPVSAPARASKQASKQPSNYFFFPRAMFGFRVWGSTGTSIKIS
jgi:hypothetical protein